MLTTSSATKVILYFLCLPVLFLSSAVFAEENFSKGNVSFSIETPSGFQVKTLPREDLAYLAVGVAGSYLKSASVQLLRDSKKAALLKNPGMRGAYLIDRGKEMLIEEGKAATNGFASFYVVTLSKEYMERDGKDLFQLQRKIEFARGDEIFILSFMATGWTPKEAAEHFDAERGVFEAMLKSFHIHPISGD